MDDPVPSDPRADLRALVGSFRSHLEARARSGVIGVSRAPSPRSALPVVAAPGVAPADVVAPAGASEADSLPALRRGAEGLQLVREELGNCTRCKLSSTRTNIVYGVGDPNADLVFVGEAPGGDEDRQGEPFVGLAGQLLTKMIAAMGYRRDEVYICNVIKCRPPSNRNPEPDEVAACEPFLKGQLGAIKPRMIVTLGKFASQSICRENTPITRLRGNFRSYEGIPVMPTYHPAYLLRTPEAKRDAWADLQAVLAALAKLGITPPAPRK